MDSSRFPLLKALVVYNNDFHPELFRTVHVYEFEGGVEEIVEREFVFHLESEYKEMKSPNKIFTRQNFNVSAHHAHLTDGVWICVLVFDMDRINQFNFQSIPHILSTVRNPKLASIPALARDLHTIFQLGNTIERGQSSQNQTQGSSQVAQERPRRLPLFDLNLLPVSDSDSEESDETAAGLVVTIRRATTRTITKLTLEDLSKYFDLPIIEASKRLKVGLTVLKRKCREFGISRWPHRKIKSLDCLIHNLQEEVMRELEEDKASAVAIAKMQRMIENEKENIEKMPFLDIQRETKRFRQDIFKRRHRARFLATQSQS